MLRKTIRNNSFGFAHTRSMKVKLKTSMLAGLCALLSVGGSLKDISKPYLGEYECKSATLGNREYADDFDFIRIELRGDERFVLSYREKDDRSTHTTEGIYEYDETNGTVLLKTREKGTMKRRFPLKDGVLLVTTMLGEKLLTLRFEQK